MVRRLWKHISKVKPKEITNQTCRILGPISSITVFGQNLVIINDIKIATELLDKRALNHSDRPTQVFAADM